MVFRSFSKLHPNGPVPHQISPPNSRFINPVRAFLAFIYLSKSHAWRGSPFWHREPPLLARASQPKNLPFQPCGRRVSPIQAASFHLQSGDGECLPATQLYLSVFTCPTVSLNLPSDSHRTPARASRPDNLTFSTPRPARLTHPDREYFPPVGCWREPPGHTACFLSLPVQHSESWSPVGRRRELPGQTTLPFKPVARRGLPVRHGDSETSRTSARARPPVGCRLSIPTKTLPFRLHLSDTVSLDLPSVAGESTPGQTTLPFLVPRWRRLPVQHSGYCAPVGRRREPHSETTYRFPLGRRD